MGALLRSVVVIIFMLITYMATTLIYPVADMMFRVTQDSQAVQNEWGPGVAETAMVFLALTTGLLVLAILIWMLAGDLKQDDIPRRRV